MFCPGGGSEERHGVAASHADRRVTAILAADVVGFSRLMERDEDGTLARLKAHRKELAEPLIAEYRGRTVKLMGDGALCEFASVVDAVRCAIQIQHGVTERERETPDADRIRSGSGSTWAMSSTRTTATCTATA